MTQVSVFKIILSLARDIEKKMSERTKEDFEKEKEGALTKKVKHIKLPF